MRFPIAALLALAFLASATPAFAQRAYLDLTIPRLIFDSTCTDSFNVPATTDGTDLTNGTLWNSTAEAPNPDSNRDDAVQTSGTPDGWCDETPWVIAGVDASMPDNGQDLYIGPILVPPAGILNSAQFDTIATSWSIDVMYILPWSSVLTDTLATHTDRTSTAANIWTYGPNPELSSQTPATVDVVHFPSTQLYLRIDLNGTGTWDINYGTFPLRNDKDKNR